jgi:hypothetical protein
MKYLVALLLLAGTALAGERTYTFDLGPNQSVPTNHPPTHYVQQWTDTIELPYLPPSVGDLQHIDITIEQYVEYTFHWELVHPQTCLGTINKWQRINHIIRLVDNNPGGAFHNWGTNSFTQAGDTCVAQTPFDGLLDFGGTSGFTSGKHIGMNVSRHRISGSDCDYYNGDRKGPFIIEVRGRLRFQFQSQEWLWMMGVTDYTWTRIRVNYVWV